MTTAVASKRTHATSAEPTDVDHDGEDGAAIEPTRVIPPELRFTTDDLADEVPDEADRSTEFDLDGFVGTIIAPHKLEEVLAQLMEAGARRATTADALYAGRRFLERVLSPDTIEHLQRRLDDDRDAFRITHLYDILERVVRVLNERLEEENRTRGVRPGQRASRRRRG